jgi:hypothetical protein
MLTFSLAKTRKGYEKEANMGPSRFFKKIPDELLGMQYLGQAYVFPSLNSEVRIGGNVGASASSGYLVDPHPVSAGCVHPNL